jgi:hypothetical protein
MLTCRVLPRPCWARRACDLISPGHVFSDGAGLASRPHAVLKLAWGTVLAVNGGVADHDESCRALFAVGFARFVLKRFLQAVFALIRARLLILVQPRVA